MTSLCAELGSILPENDAHGVSISLPTWSAVVGYEQGDPGILTKLKSGYPRFRFHQSLEKLMNVLLYLYSVEDAIENGPTSSSGRAGSFEDPPREAASVEIMVFPSVAVANRFASFMHFRNNDDSEELEVCLRQVRNSKVVAVFFPASRLPHAKLFWQHSGEITSSRLAEATLHRILEYFGSTTDHPLTDLIPTYPVRLPVDILTLPLANQLEHFPKERILVPFGSVPGTVPERSTSKGALVQRIADIISDASFCSAPVVEVADITPCICGMAAIFSAFRLIQRSYSDCNGGSLGHCVVFGFPYLDTLKILQRPEWNAGGVTFFGHGSDEDLAALEQLLATSILETSVEAPYRNRIMAIFTEFPTNPLLKCADMIKLVALADKYGVILVADDTISNFANVNLLCLQDSHGSLHHGVDILCSSLTKIVSGEGNVMGGSFILNSFTTTPKYHSLRTTLNQMLLTNDITTPFDNDIHILEINSRLFLSRSHQINVTTMRLAHYFESKWEKGVLSELYYPGLCHTITARSNKVFYDAVLRGSPVHGTHVAGYGCLISLVIAEPYSASIFFDHLELNKGPSLGTNFTLVCPYTLLAHFNELEWARKYGVQSTLIRVSVGLEAYETLEERFERAFAIMENNIRLSQG